MQPVKTRAVGQIARWRLSSPCLRQSSAGSSRLQEVEGYPDCLKLEARRYGRFGGLGATVITL